MRSVIPRISRDGDLRPDAEALYFDGHSARPHKVGLWIDHATATLALRGHGVDLSWRLSDLRQVPDQAGAGELVFGSVAAPLARVQCADRDFVSRMPHLRAYRPRLSRWRLWKWAGLALSSVAVIILVLIPLMANQLATLIPEDGERALGEATLEQIRSTLDASGAAPLPFCENPAGLAALEKIETRLAAEDITLTVRVLDHDMVNAFALPGGHIVFFRGLIEAATKPEQLAAVFAHEMGHVVSRDPTRHALRSAGSIGILGLLFGDFAGGALVLFLTEQLIEARYSQDAETAADIFAYDVLLNAEIAPSAMGDMFETFRARFGDIDGVQAHFLSHPKLSDRIDAARAATPQGFKARPLLSEQEWQALQAICD
ncbi:M48 family metallopeptidase [Shimia sp. SDUM112013]|uniref:M48 family metallopeptidase n=1 Tax=Shimia sp. SDUM112013 TaxID=3136160 RepID=UPI0032EC9B5F